MILSLLLVIFPDIRFEALHPFCDVDENRARPLWQFHKLKLLRLFGQQTRLRSHALEVGPKNEEAVVLEDAEMQERVQFALLNFFPDSDADEAEIDNNYDCVGNDSAGDAKVFVQQPHL